VHLGLILQMTTGSTKVPTIAQVEYTPVCKQRSMHNIS
jgi:hypothetical protein